MIKIAAVLAGVLFLGACSSPYGAFVRGEIATRGAKEADAVWQSSQWAMCQAQTVGAMFRNVKTQKEMDAYLAFCGRTGAKAKVPVE